MENIKIEILSTNFTPFRDTTVGQEYDAILLKGNEEVPYPWYAFEGQTNDGVVNLLMMDDVEDDVAVDFETYEGIAFKVISE